MAPASASNGLPKFVGVAVRTTILNLETCIDKFYIAACLEGDDNTCVEQKISGYYTPGTFQQFVATSAHYVTPIPDGVDSAEAAPILCAGLTVYSGLRKANTKPGDWIVISGAGGGLGHLAVQYASRVLGLRVIAIDHGSKRNLVMDCGAEVFYDYTQYNDADLEEAVKKGTTGGRGANAVLVVSAANKSYEQALKFLKPLGTLVCIGMPEGTAVPIQSAYPARITNQQFRIVGKRTVANLRCAADMNRICHWQPKRGD